MLGTAATMVVLFSHRLRCPRSLLLSAAVTVVPVLLLDR